jgi:hypothetical protein
MADFKLSSDKKRITIELAPVLPDGSQIQVIASTTDRTGTFWNIEPGPRTPNVTLDQLDLVAESVRQAAAGKVENEREKFDDLIKQLRR